MPNIYLVYVAQCQVLGFNPKSEARGCYIKFPMDILLPKQHFTLCRAFEDIEQNKIGLEKNATMALCFGLLNKRITKLKSLPQMM